MSERERARERERASGYGTKLVPSNVASRIPLYDGSKNNGNPLTASAVFQSLEKFFLLQSLPKHRFFSAHGQSSIIIGTYEKRHINRYTVSKWFDKNNIGKQDTITF